jgi:hypothetical protein
MKPAERIWLWWTDGYSKGTPAGAAQVSYTRIKSAGGVKVVEYMRVMPGDEIATLHRRLHCQQATIRQMKALIPDIDKPNR